MSATSSSSSIGVADHYTKVAIFLHWVIAAGILALIVIGLVMTQLTLSPMHMFKLYQLHKSIGITVLLAAVLRLAWRLTHSPPPLPSDMPLVERKAAAASHLVLYAFLFGLPLTGWALVSASVFNIPTVLYGRIPWPDLPFLPDLANKASVEAVLKRVHGYGAWCLIAVLGLHIGASLRHHFFLKDTVLTGMLPRLPGRISPRAAKRIVP
jgi:cytochrome b561